MRIVVVGLTLSSSWGNGHATTYRALLSALAADGHAITFFECDRPWYASNRDFASVPYGDLRLYDDFEDLKRARPIFEAADAIVIGSYVVEAIEVAQWLVDTFTAPVLFYDIDTPVTLAALDAGRCAYLARDAIPRFASYLSFTGGPTLARLVRDYGARRADALYCCVDPHMHRPLAGTPRFALGYLGTYSADRQPTVERLLIEPARRRPDLTFAIAGPQYPESLALPDNVERFEHIPPERHARFYSDCRFTLNVTRDDMRAAGWSPSVRLFEAAAVEAPIISDTWPGLDDFFKPDRDIFVAAACEDVLNLLEMSEERREGVAKSARDVVLRDHTSKARARSLVQIVEDIRLQLQNA